MSLDPARVLTLIPSQFFVFTLPNPLTHDCYVRGPFLRFAVLDSPTPPPPPTPGSVPIIAAMIVPAHRESDWIFSTESGHSQLLHTYPHVSRLVLIGNNPPDNSVSAIYVRPPDTLSVRKEKEKLENALKPLLIALHPNVCLEKGVPNPEFLTYEDTAVFRVTVGTFTGSIVGEFLVEDVEVESKPSGGRKDFSRRLRFKRMPNLIQSEVRLIPDITTNGGPSDSNLDLPGLTKLNEVKFKVDPRVLIPTYLNAMVSGIFLIASHPNLRTPPRALCLGVGGGALLSFLNARLWFHVVGVDSDEDVLSVARNFFGLREGNGMKIFHRDAPELVEAVARRLSRQNTTHGLEANNNNNGDCLDSKFDVVMVDLDAGDARFGIGGPPATFVKRPVLVAAKSVLHDHGVFVMNVAIVNHETYWALVLELKSVFRKVFEIVVGNKENYVLVATLSPIASPDHFNVFSVRLGEAVSRTYIDSMKEV